MLDGVSGNVSVSEHAKSAIISISGSFAFHLQNEFRKAYEDLSEGVDYFTLDIGGVDYMDSSGLGMLLVMKKYLDEANVQYEIANSRDQTLDLLKMTHFNQFFKINGEEPIK